MTAVLLMTSWWLGPQLAAAMAGMTKQDGLCAPSQAACAAKLERPGEITIGGLRPYPVLLPLSLWSKLSGWCCSGETHGFAKGCTVVSLARGPQQAGGAPPPAALSPLARAEGWADPLNHRSSNFPGRIRSWRFSGMTVLCSPSWPPVNLFIS